MSAPLHPHSLQRHTPLGQTAVCCTFGRPITLSTVDGRPKKHNRRLRLRLARLALDMEEPLFYNNSGVKRVTAWPATLAFATLGRFSR
ncbi:hypothetical protein MRX96_056369 [Rhipicephalus microplus]